jgi:CheY-like chemotaxis protein
MSKRVLVVEDQADSRQIIRDMLAPTDYEITEAQNGEEALAAIARQRPDLILMDVQMPIMDDYTGARVIEEIGWRKGTPTAEHLKLVLSVKQPSWSSADRH